MPVATNEGRNQEIGVDLAHCSTVFMGGGPNVVPPPASCLSKFLIFALPKAATRVRTRPRPFARCTAPRNLKSDRSALDTEYCRSSNCFIY